jgi:tRNA pseudouridine38-40 synthase
MTVLNGASRTDTGVHAAGQVVHFDTTRTIPPDRWKVILNHSLSPDLHVVDASYAHPLFHSRFDVHEKEYRYTIDQGEFDPLRRRYAWYTEAFDVSILEREMKSVLGTHDFTSFCTGEQDIPIRTIREARVERDGTKVVLVFIGEGFLHHMIRILVATLVRIAQGRMKEDIASLIAARSRVKTKEIAPAAGLCLMRVKY